MEQAPLKKKHDTELSFLQKKETTKKTLPPFNRWVGKATLCKNDLAYLGILSNPQTKKQKF